MREEGAPALLTPVETDISAYMLLRGIVRGQSQQEPEGNSWQGRGGAKLRMIRRPAGGARRTLAPPSALSICPLTTTSSPSPILCSHSFPLLSLLVLHQPNRPRAMSTQATPTSAIDLVLPLDVHKLILDDLFHVHEPLGPQSTIVSPDKGAAHLLLVSKAFSGLVLPRMWRTVAIQRAEDWTTLFATDTGALVGNSDAAQARRALVKTVLLDFAIFPPLEHVERRVDRILSELSIPKALAFGTMISLSPVKDNDDSGVRLADVVMQVAERKYKQAAAADELPPGGRERVMLGSQLRLETSEEILLGAADELEYLHLDLLKSASTYEFKAEIGDERVVLVLTGAAVNAFDGSYRGAIRGRKSVILLSPGRKEAKDEEDGRGYKLLEESVRDPLRELLQQTDLPHIRLVGFPKTWPREFDEWSAHSGVRLGNSRGVEWVMEDGSIVPFMPDDEPNASEVSHSVSTPLSTYIFAQLTWHLSLQQEPVDINAQFASLVGNLLGQMQNLDFNALFNPTQAT